ncbi:MAG: flagella basal body P-ring formation protein FlgA [Rhodobacterales bacterium CG2_30_65_12]|nr:MAG: flagella basal body P-ring formation protein FlgA [Rhodobacterales bacterium CG2_30_65_12]
MTRLAFLVLTLAAAPAAADTVIAARTIRAQTLLSATDVTLAKGDTAGAFGLLDEVVGQEARVALYGGRPIGLSDVGPPAVIDRNQIVLLVYRSGGLTMTAEGRALGRAGVGDRLKVMNLTSHQTVTGLVRADGSVTVNPNFDSIPDIPTN